MSDFTDDILDGIFCQGCGVFIDDEPCGYQRFCADCKPVNQINLQKQSCPHCGKRVKEAGLADHIKAKHS